MAESMPRPGIAPEPVLVGHDHVLGDTLAAIADALRQRGYRVRRPPDRGPELTPALVQDVAVIVVSSRTRLSEELLAQAGRLRGVVFPSIGIESCDLDAATRLGVVVANGATSENVRSMAEATVMLMAALRLDLPTKQRQMTTHRAHEAPPPVSGRMLSGATVGLLGFGRIGREVARMLETWRVAQVLVHTRSPPREPLDVAASLEFVDLPTLLRQSELVSLHLPLTAATRGIIGPTQLETMKRGCILINTSRGGLVDELALADALRTGHLAAAAIDTFTLEPPDPAHPLFECENVILTRHNIGHTHELFASLVPTAIANVDRIMTGHAPLHMCNPNVRSVCQIE